jgi:hypothetical protein
MSSTPLNRKGTQPKQQQRSFSTRQLGMLLLVLYYVAAVRLLSGMARMLTVCKYCSVSELKLEQLSGAQVAFAWHRVWWVPQPQPIDAPASLFSEGRAMNMTRILADDIGDRAVRPRVQALCRALINELHAESLEMHS